MGYHRVLKLARTIADLAESDYIQSVHLAEALHTVPVFIGTIVTSMILPGRKNGL
jgi:hypothetical protein